MYFLYSKSNGAVSVTTIYGALIFFCGYLVFSEKHAISAVVPLIFDKQM
jgi:hypothetical protein